MIGRSHGIHAEPVTFGLALAGHLAECKRGRARLRAARTEIAVGKIAGAVGTYAHLDPAIESRALAALGLTPETVSTQVVARDRHAGFFAALAVVAAGVERLATNVRHWQRTEVGEAEERFSAGQKGSSAMPHKRQEPDREREPLRPRPRGARRRPAPRLEDVAVCPERDKSHYSVARIIAPDAPTALAYRLDRAAALVDVLVVHPEALGRNLDRTGERLLQRGGAPRAGRSGPPRQAAYAIVQRCAMQRHRGRGPLPGDLCAADPELSALLPAADLARCFDLDHALAHVDAIIDRAPRGAVIGP